MGQRSLDVMRPTGRLHVASAGELSTGVNTHIRQLRNDGIAGAAWVSALTELQARLAPAPHPALPRPPAAGCG